MHHHNNHRNSTSNHSNPQHHRPSKPDYPTGPSPGGRYQPKKASVLSRIRDRFKEKPATKEEVEQLGLNAKREVYKTTIQKAKSARPSRFAFLSGGGGGGSRRSSGGGGRRRSREDTSNFFGSSDSKGGGFLDFDSGPILSMFGGGNQQKRGKNQKSGLEELF